MQQVADKMNFQDPVQKYAECHSWDMSNSNATKYHEIKVGILDNTCFKENVPTFEILVGWTVNFKIRPQYLGNKCRPLWLEMWSCLSQSDPLSPPSNDTLFCFANQVSIVVAVHLTSPPNATWCKLHTKHANDQAPKKKKKTEKLKYPKSAPWMDDVQQSREVLNLVWTGVSCSSLDTPTQF